MKIIIHWVTTLLFLGIISFAGGLVFQNGLEAIDVNQDYWSCFWAFFWFAFTFDLMRFYSKFDEELRAK